ncbi:hypothetical protein BT69DRAFT_1334542 [Atractiella rhizophila]|nr:hypothetical protein BT69DRAFT_1334542 [Atractiella rhizophila]
MSVVWAVDAAAEEEDAAAEVAGVERVGVLGVEVEEGRGVGGRGGGRSKVSAIARAAGADDAAASAARRSASSHR